LLTMVITYRLLDRSQKSNRLSDSTYERMPLESGAFIF